MTPGSGKTLISVLLVKEKADEYRQRNQKKLICFLAPKVDLVKQVSLHDPTSYEHIIRKEYQNGCTAASRCAEGAH